MSGVRAYVGKTLALSLALAPVIYFIPVPVEHDVVFCVVLALLTALLCGASAWRIARSGICTLYFPVPLMGLSLLALLACVSAGASVVSWTYAMWGTSFEPGTIAFSVLFLLWAIVGFAERERYAQIGIAFVLACGAGSILFLLIALMGGPLGDWTAVAWLAAAALVCAVALPSAAVPSPALLFSTTVPVAVALWLCGMPAPALCALAACVLALVFAQRDRSSLWRVGTMVLLLPTILLSGFFSSVQRDAVVHPSTAASVLVLDLAIEHGAAYTPFIGTGPLTFPDAWTQYYPREINMSPLGLADVREGRSSALTLLMEIGVLGIVLLLASAAFALRDALTAHEETAAAVPAASLLVFSIAALVCGVPPAAIWYLAALSLGAAASFASPVRRRLLSGMAAYAFAGICAAAFAGTFWVALHQTAAYVYHARAQATSPSDPIERATLARRAAEQWPSPAFFRDAAQAAIEAALLRPRLPSQRIAPDEADDAEQLALSALNIDELSFPSWLQYASVLTNRAVAGDGDAGARVGKVIGSAAALSPQRPEPPYLLAVLAHSAGDDERALTALRLSLTLKSDYADARSLYRTIIGADAP